MKEEAQEKSHLLLKKWIDPFKLFVPKGKNDVIHSPGIHVPSTFERSARVYPVNPHQHSHGNRRRRWTCGLALGKTSMKTLDFLLCQINLRAEQQETRFPYHSATVNKAPSGSAAS